MCIRDRFKAHELYRGSVLAKLYFHALRLIKYICLSRLSSRFKLFSYFITSVENPYDFIFGILVKSMIKNILYIQAPFWHSLKVHHRLLLKFISILFRKVNIHLVFNSKNMMLDATKSPLGKYFLKKHSLKASIVEPVPKIINTGPLPQSKDDIISIIGRISPEKRMHLGIIAFHRVLLKIKNPKLKLFIVGEVNDKKYLQLLRRLIRKYRLCNNVFIITDNVKNSIRNIYAKSKVLWNFSEGFFGLVNIEAMSFGTVPIVTEGCSDTIKNNYSGFVAYTLKDFIDITVKILENEKIWQKISKNSYDFSKKFSITRFNRKLLNIITE